jgi:thymidylate kinase
LWLDCPIDTAMARVAAQPHPAADRSPELVREVAQRFERPDDALRIDATLSLEEMICQAEQAIA